MIEKKARGIKEGTKLNIRPFPVNTIKKVMRENTQLQISHKGLHMISEHLEDYMNIITRMAIEELERTNSNPNRPHYVYTRLSDRIIQRVIWRINNQLKEVK